MASRRKARILAFQALYAWESSGAKLEELLAFPWLDPAKLETVEEEIAAFTRLIVSGCIENIEEVDRSISAHLAHWPFERLKKVDLAILRMGAYCLLYQDEIPPQITIDEAIEIAKEFGSEESYKFINGVLDGVYRSAKGTAAKP